MKKKVAIGAFLVAAPLLAIGGGLPYAFQSGHMISAPKMSQQIAPDSFLVKQMLQGAVK